MSNVKDVIVAKIDAVEMRASTYRLARRLLDRAHEANGLVVLTYDETLQLCDTDSHETVRGHLARLAAMDLITYRRNSQVNVYWHGWPEALALCHGGAKSVYLDTNRATVEQARGSGMAQPRSEQFQDGAGCVYSDTNRATVEQEEFLESIAGAEVFRGGAKSVYLDTNRATVEQADPAGADDLTDARHRGANCVYSDTNRATVEHLYSRLSSKQASYSLLHDQPACLLEEGGPGGGPDGDDGCAAPAHRLSPDEPDDAPDELPEEPPDDPVSEAEYERAVTLLMDPRLVGVDEATARRWAKGRSFELVRAHVFRWRREVAAGRDFSAGVIGRRLRERWDAPVTEAEKESLLWQLYQTESDLRSKYIPAEYSDIILG